VTGKARIDTTVPALILKFVPDRYAHGRLGAVRSLGRLGVPVFALDERPRTPAGRSRYATAVSWQMEDEPSTASLERLRALGERIGGRPVLITTDDLGTLWVDQHRNQLSDRFRIPHRPEGLPLQLADKAQLFHLCREVGIPTPDAGFPQSRADLEEYIDTHSAFPVVVKSMDPRILRQRPNADSVSIAKDPDALLAIYDEAEDFSKPNLMLQEYIPGGPETVWMFNGYFDSQSECTFAACGRKIRQRPPSTGATTLGMCEDNDVVEHLTRRFMKEIGYTGIVDMGYRYDARDGNYKLLDVNPRMGATFRLFADQRGNDVVRAMYLDMTGQNFAATEPDFGRKWLVEPLDLWSARASIAAGDLSSRTWLRSLRGVDETAWFATDDLRPFVAMAAAFARDSYLSVRSRRVARSVDRTAVSDGA